MIRIQLQVELNYQVYGHGADFLFNVQAAHTPCQILSAERLTLSQAADALFYTEEATGNRCMRLRAAPGELQLSYQATVDLSHYFADPQGLPEIPVNALPPEVLGYLYPSRYCQSDQFLQLANNEFGNLRPGYDRVRAVCNWVNRHVVFTSNSTSSNTSAIDTFRERVGVCRDFAHLMIALCRALNVPTRFVTGTDYGADPALGPPDFHAYVEAYLGDRWYIFDPSGLTIPLGLVRFGTGRDAADVAFATSFGNVGWRAPYVRAAAVEEGGGGIELPFHCQSALSTDRLGDQSRSESPAQVGTTELVCVR